MRLLVIEHDHVSPLGPVAERFADRGYDLARHPGGDEPTRQHSCHLRSVQITNRILTTRRRITMDITPLQKAFHELLDSAAIVADSGETLAPPAGEWNADQILAHVSVVTAATITTVATVASGSNPTYDNRIALDTLDPRTRHRKRRRPSGAAQANPRPRRRPLRSLCHGGKRDRTGHPGAHAAPIQRHSHGRSAPAAAGHHRRSRRRGAAQPRETTPFPAAACSRALTGDIVIAGPCAALSDVVTGPVISTARRLALAAADGDVLLGPGTLRLVRGAAIVKALETAGGWLVLELVATAAEEPRAAMIGREQEISWLRAAFRRAVRSGAPVRATVVGDAGIGKSRLAREVVASLGPDAHAITIRCGSPDAALGFHPVRQAVVQAAGLDGWRALHSLLETAADGASAVDEVAGAIGLRCPPATADELAPPMLRLLEALAWRAPLVVVLDDLHWADPAFLVLIERLEGMSGSVLLLGLMRLDLADDSPRFERADVLRLGPLTDGDVARLAVAEGGRSRLAGCAGSWNSPKATRSTPSSCSRRRTTASSMRSRRRWSGCCRCGSIGSDPESATFSAAHRLVASTSTPMRSASCFLPRPGPSSRSTSRRWYASGSSTGCPAAGSGSLTCSSRWRRTGASPWRTGRGCRRRSRHERLGSPCLTLRN
jgi:hypothetical protein